MRDYKFCNYYKGWHKPALTLEWGSYFSAFPQIHFSFGYGQLFINLPYDTGRDECENPQYGFYLYGEGRKLFDSFWWCWGMKKYCFNMPWSYDWVRTSNLKKDGTWENEVKGNRKDFYLDKWKDVVKYETFPYTYTLKSGKVQNVLATVKTEEMEWRQRWLKWTKLFNKVRRSIDVSFSEEVGEGTGSWKGGTVGCGYNLLPNETPEQCLRRMEKERKFGR